MTDTESTSSLDERLAEARDLFAMASKQPLDVAEAYFDTVIEAVRADERRKRCEAQTAIEVEWNVARWDEKTGDLWDVFDEECVTTLEEAEAERKLWAAEVDGDPVVNVRRRAGRAPGEWERF